MKTKQKKSLKERSKKAHLNHKKTNDETLTTPMKKRENKLTDGKFFGKKWFREH